MLPNSASTPALGADIGSKQYQKLAGTTNFSSKDDDGSFFSPAESGLSRPRTISPVKRLVPEDWEPDSLAQNCRSCNKSFTILNRKHHCRNCGGIFCSDCTKTRVLLLEKNYHEPVRVCTRCAFAVNRSAKITPNLQLKAQISAMEEVSQALMSENTQLRSLVETLERIRVEQAKAIEALRSPQKVASGQGNSGPESTAAVPSVTSHLAGSLALAVNTGKRAPL